MPNKAPAIDASSERHGKAAAIALWLTLEELNEYPPPYGPSETTRKSRSTVAAYLAGYAKASGRARQGFVALMGDFLATLNTGRPNVIKWQTPPRLRAEMTDVERKAHAKLWLKGADHGR